MRALAIASALLLAAAPAARAGGFELPYHSAKALSLAGAFVAQADDPSAVFYNPGGLALLGKKPKVSAGMSFHTLNEALFQGLPPGVGAETTGAQETITTPIPHAYAIQGLGEKAKAGLGVYSPFLHESQWGSKDTFSGRFLSLDTDIRTYDVHAAVGYQLAAGLGVGAGVIYRLAEVTRLSRSQTLDPFTRELVDFASRASESGYEEGLGWSVGVLQRTGAFSWGLTYRSPVEVDFEGTMKLTQISTGNDQLDSLLAASVPFDMDLGYRSQLEFPEIAVVGVALSLTDSLIVEVDYQQTGWSSVDRLDFAFPANDEFDESIQLSFDDTASYRLGVRFASSGGAEIRFGAAIEESPQPDATVSPIFADNDQTVVAAGYGKDWLDLAFAWIDRGSRRTVSHPEINGSYSGSTWILALTISE